MSTLTDKQAGAFHARFCPLAGRLYRSALIVAGNRRRAEQLQVDIYLKAFVEYLHATSIPHFEYWLAPIVRECLDDYGFVNRQVRFEKEAVSQLEHVMLAKLVDCRNGKLRDQPLFTV